jgi:hypothetical protein
VVDGLLLEVREMRRSTARTLFEKLKGKEKKKSWGLKP